LAKEKGILHINIYGDSLFTINVMNGTQILHSYTLRPIFKEAKQNTTTFSHISLTHVYRNKNSKADQLSKDRLELDKGTWKIWEKSL
jgi:hypothetical protein